MDDTLQSNFDRVWEHFVTNRAPPGYDEETQACTYRGPGGVRCAIGLLLSDEEAARMQERELGSAVDHHAETVPERILDEADFFIELQRAHDGAVAEANGLGEGVDDTTRRARFTVWVRHELEELAGRWGLAVVTGDVELEGQRSGF